MNPARVLLVAGCSLLAVQCARRAENDVLSKLPELPAEVAAELVPARTAPVLVTRPRVTVPPRPAPPPPPTPRQDSCTTKFIGSVTYPITVCYIFENPPQTIPRFDASGGAGTAEPVKGVRFFRLSRFGDAGRDLLCTTRTGPWHAEATEIVDCNDFRTTRLELVGAPEPHLFTWECKRTDVPPALGLSLLSNFTAIAPPSCSCCGGFKECPGEEGCVPLDQKCNHSPA
jgi:hypothetical protein